jgi:hypothetical protein
LEPYDRNRRVLVASGIVALVLIVVPPVLGALAAFDRTTWREHAPTQDSQPARDPRVIGRVSSPSPNSVAAPLPDD